MLLSIRPYTPKYTARILLQYFEYTAKYLKKCRLPHTGVGVWNWLSGFLTPPPIFRVLNSFFYIPWAHRMTRYMCQNGCFGGVFLVCQVMLTIEEHKRDATDQIRDRNRKSLQDHATRHRKEKKKEQEAQAATQAAKEKEQEAQAAKERETAAHTAPIDPPHSAAAWIPPRDLSLASIWTAAG